MSENKSIINYSYINTTHLKQQSLSATVTGSKSSHQNIRKRANTEISEGNRYTPKVNFVADKNRERGNSGSFVISPPKSPSKTPLHKNSFNQLTMYESYNSPSSNFNSTTTTPRSPYFRRNEKKSFDSEESNNLKNLPPKYINSSKNIEKTIPNRVNVSASDLQISDTIKYLRPSRHNSVQSARSRAQTMSVRDDFSNSDGESAFSNDSDRKISLDSKIIPPTAQLLIAYHNISGFKKEFKIHKHKHKSHCQTLG